MRLTLRNRRVVFVLVKRTFAEAAELGVWKLIAYSP